MHRLKRLVILAAVLAPASCSCLGLDAQQHYFVLAVDGRDRFEGENEPPAEQSSAHDELVGIVGVAFVANAIEAREGAPLLVQDEVALGRGKQPADLAPLS
jgi:hypothetical protein